MNHNAIRNTHPNVITIINGDCFDADGNPVAITQSLVDDEVARLQAEHDSKAYARARADAYASTGDQLDMQYWDALNSTTTWADHVAEIKARFPK